MDNETFIVPPYKIECYLAEDEEVKVVKELLDKHGKVCFGVQILAAD